MSVKLDKSYKIANSILKNFMVGLICYEFWLGVCMQILELIGVIKHEMETNCFQDASDNIQNIIFSLNIRDFIPLVSEIGTIPEFIEHDSTEEKLYTKVSDIILAKCFIELGLKAMVIRERANCADVIARSSFYNYSLVGDAKAFRLSRTAKNQKDFKVESMVHWRCDNNYSVLCCPYFQYPKNKSQIYGQAIDGNVSLFSWEYFSILLQNNIKESLNRNLEELWNYSSVVAQNTPVSSKNLCFFNKQNLFLKKYIDCSDDDFNKYFHIFKNGIILRGENEIKYWEDKINIIKHYSRNQAIEMLIKSLKLNEKINSINSFINQLRG